MPSYETQDMVSNKSLSKSTKRTMLNLASYKFQRRLKHKATSKGCHVEIVNESYASKHVDIVVT